MTYSKTTWVNGGPPSISATNLNKIEQGIEDALPRDGSSPMTGQLATITGTVSVPALARTGDPDTGVFFPEADTMAFSTNSGEAMRIISNQNIGIGTASPSTKLTVNGTVTATNFSGIVTLPADPVNPLEAATKQYVDTSFQSMKFKTSVRVATTENLAVSSSTSTTITLSVPLTVLDNITLSTNDRILVKNQSAGLLNGIYVYTNSTTLTRATDTNTSEKVKSGMIVFVEEGIVNATIGYYLSTPNPIVLGTTALTFVQNASQPSESAPIMDGVAAIGAATKFARADHVHPTDTTRAPLASPAFTGTPAAPTATVDTNTTQLATTAFVLAQASATTPAMNGSSAVGTSTRFARADHVHPTDTSRAPLASPAFTGNVGINKESSIVPLHVKTSGTGDLVIFESDDSDSSEAPDIILYRNSASPAANDVLGGIIFRGKNFVSLDKTYASITSQIKDTATTLEDGILGFNTIKEGTLSRSMTINDIGVGIGVTATSRVFEVSGRALIQGMNLGGGPGESVATSVALGTNALPVTASNAYNSAVGYTALAQNQSGLYNSGFGAYALSQNVVGSNNSAFGYGALNANISSNGGNTAVGAVALGNNTSGSENTAIGNYASTVNTVGSNNVAIGARALAGAATASNNIAIGVSAGRFDIAGSNTIIGSLSGSTGMTSTMLFGAGTTERFRVDSNGYMLINYSSSNGAYRLQVNGQIFATSSTIATSDINYKESISPIEGGLAIVNGLNPVQFNWKEHAIHNFDTETPTIGFIAQEVEQLVSNKEYVNSIIKKSSISYEKDGEEIQEDFLGIAESNLIPILTKAIQELSAKVDALEAKLANK